MVGRRYSRHRVRDRATASALGVVLVVLLIVTSAGAATALTLASGPASMLGATQAAVRDLLAGTSQSSIEDRRARLEEAIRRSAERERNAGLGALPEPSSTRIVTAADRSTPPSGRNPTPVRPASTPTSTPTPTDRERLRFILGQALTSYDELPPDWKTNVEVVTALLNDKTIPANQTLSFADAVGPVTLERGFRTDLPSSLLWGNEEESCLAGGVCQVASTLLQAAFAAGLQIVEHHNFPSWYPSFGTGPDRMPGLDARVGQGADLKIRNNTNDAIRIEAWADGRTVGVVLYGVDPGWTVERTEPRIDSRTAAPRNTVRREVPTLPAGRNYTIAEPASGFNVTISRNVIRDGQVIDRYQRTVRYREMAGVRLIGVLGATPTPTPTRTPTPVSAPATPTPSAFNPSDYRRDDGKVRVPMLVGLPEAEARRRIEAVGLTNTVDNYQGRGDVPDSALGTVPVGHVLSQMPPAETIVNAGETIYLAVRRE